MAGTSVSADAWASLADHAAALGVLAGLLVGKPVGVLLFTWIGVRLGLTSLPAGLTWRHLTAVAVLAGIGVTVSLFIARQAMDPADLDVVKLAILWASTVPAVVGVWILAMSPALEEVEEGGS